MSETPSRTDWNANVIAEFRRNGGKLSGPFEHMSMVLLHTWGAKTGQERVNPLASRRDDQGNLVVFASKGGAPVHPDWYRNLVANPKVLVEYGTDRFEARARTATGDERTRLWEAQKSELPQFAEYEKTAPGREIPVVVLERS